MPNSFQLLGFGFVPTYEKGVKGKYQVVVSDKSWRNLKAALKEITRKTSPLSFEKRVWRLKQVQRGWVNYFRMGSISAKLQQVDSWLRNRIRYCIWHDWRAEYGSMRSQTMGWPERKRKNLIKLGVPKGKAYAFSRTRKGGWAIAQSPILNTTITLARLKKRGYESLSEHYLKVHPMFNEPLYMVVRARA